MRFAPALTLPAPLLPILLLAGCSTSFDPPSPTSSLSALGALQGTIHGGQQPVSGSHLYVYAAGTSGYGAPSVSLLSAYSSGSFPTTPDANGNYYITSDANGRFTLTGEYTCTPGQQVYLYASGGDSGGGPNPAIGLMAVLGQCPAGGSFAAASPTVIVNEVTTIAAAYALAGFAVDANHIADDEGVTGNTTAAQAKAGMANAFANAANLADIASGAALTTTPAGNGAVPQAEIDTLANILGSCVNSIGTTTGCTTLFQGATADGTSAGVQPTETASAAINIAHHPGAAANVALVSLQTANSPFQPALSATTTPNDFTLGLTFTGGGLNFCYSIAIDSVGNAWIANRDGGGVTELAPLGRALSPSSGFLYKIANNNPTAVAVDVFDNIWLADISSNSPVKLSSTGALLSPAAGFTGGGVQAPFAIATDSAGDVWLTNSTGGVSEFSNAGVALSPSTGYTSVPVAANGQTAIAIDASGNAWAATPLALAELSPTGSALSPSTGFTGAGIYSPLSMAIDGSGSVWLANYLGSISKLSNAGSALSPTSGFTGSGLFVPVGIAIDGAGNAWVGDYAGQSNASSKLGNISEFSSSGTPLSPQDGFLGGGLSEPQAIALDGSGDVWVANIGAPASVVGGNIYYPNGSVSEFIGVATPVATPLAAGVLYNKLGARP